jgi:hypothetical protein
MRIRRKRNACENLIGNGKGIGHLADLDVDEGILLKWILKVLLVKAWAQSRVQVMEPVKTVVPQKTGGDSYKSQITIL